MAQVMNNAFLRDATTNALVVTGTGELAYAENTVAQTLTAAGVTAVPGLSIVVPANSGAVELEYFEPGVSVQFAGTATTATSANVRLMIEDEAGTVIVNTPWQSRAIIASELKIHSMIARRRVANNAIDKTYTAKIFVANVTNITNVQPFRGPGAITEASISGVDVGPAYLRARAA